MPSAKLQHSAPQHPHKAVHVITSSFTMIQQINCQKDHLFFYYDSADKLPEAYLLLMRKILPIKKPKRVHASWSHILRTISTYDADKSPLQECGILMRDIQIRFRVALFRILFKVIEI